jgi:hypothetical protein
MEDSLPSLIALQCSPMLEIAHHVFDVVGDASLH